MPPTRNLMLELPVLPLLLACCLLAACPADSSGRQAQVPPPVDVDAPAPDSVPSAAGPAHTPSGPPPERYAILPPGAVDSSQPGDAAENSNSDNPAAPAPADPGLVPNAGAFDLTGVRLGMTSAEVYGRFGSDSGWEYNSQFVPGSETGVVVARPKDPRARASEMFYLDDGRVVAFLRAVNEDGQAFNTTRDELVRQYGSAADHPPDWARDAGPLRSWRSTPNEQSLFWGNLQRRSVLTAGHSPGGSETVYMLLDVDRIEHVYRSVQQFGQPAPEQGDTSWNNALPPSGSTN